MSNSFRIGDLVRVPAYCVGCEGGMGLIVGIDFNPRLHQFPMYVVDMLESGNRLFLHPNDVEGVSLTSRAKRPMSHGSPIAKGDDIK